MANFKHAPRLCIRGRIRRWSLHCDDFIPLVLQNVSFAGTVDSLRSDLHHLNCAQMPRYMLDQLEERMESLWKAIKWANDQHGVRLSNPFRTACSVDVYNTKRLELPTDGGSYQLRISVQGLHCDSRQGPHYTPILIMDEVIAVRMPTITAGRKRLQPVTEDTSDNDDEDDTSDDDEDNTSDEDVHEPAVKRQRLYDDESSADEAEILAAHAQPPEDETLWIDEFLNAVRSSADATAAADAAAELLDSSRFN